jgi:hypothetical protein
MGSNVVDVFVVERAGLNGTHVGVQATLHDAQVAALPSGQPEGWVEFSPLRFPAVWLHEEDSSVRITRHPLLLRSATHGGADTPPPDVGESQR